MTFEISAITFSEIEITSIQFIEAKVDKVERIDMYAVLVGAGLWLVLEGFVNGYVFTEAGVDRLHVLLQQEFAAKIN